jgi:zinc/manganese transport system permease protein
MLGHEFMRNALLAGTFIALACGLVGYFVVLRAQVFAGDALGHVGFTGALAAAAAGVSLRAGLFVVTIGGALLLGALGDRARARAADDVAIGSFFAWALGLGVLFLSIFTTNGSGNDGTAGVRVLFGSIFGLTARDALISTALAVLAIVLVLGIARPLLFASLDPLVAAAQGVHVRALGFGLLALLGLVAAQASQAVGTLLLLGLLAAPAGAAHRLASNPYRGLALSAGLAVGSVWVGLTLSYLVAAIPPSTAIVGTATAAYVVTLAARPRATAWKKAPG